MRIGLGGDVRMQFYLFEAPLTPFNLNLVTPAYGLQAKRTGNVTLGRSLELHAAAPTSDKGSH